MADDSRKSGPWLIIVGVISGNGTVLVSGYNGTEAHDVPDGSSVTIEAVADDGWTFERWEHWTDTGGYTTASTSPAYTFTANAGADSMPSYPAICAIFFYAVFSKGTTPPPTGGGKLLCGRSGALIFGKSGTLLYGDKKMT